MALRRTTSKSKLRTAKRPAITKKNAVKRVATAKRTAIRTTARRTIAKRPVARRAPAKRTRTVTARRTTATRPRKATARARMTRKVTARRAPARSKVQTARRLNTKKKVGIISHYFNKIGVAVVESKGRIEKGDRISIEGSTTNFKQKVRSMQHNNKPIELVGPRSKKSIGLKVNHRVRRKDIIYQI